MGIFKKRSADELAQLKSELSAMSARLDATDQAKEATDQEMRGIAARVEASDASRSTTGDEVREIADRLDSTSADLGDQVKGIVMRLKTPPPPPPVGPDDITAVREQMQRICGRIDEIDIRVTSISMELANQISELSGDVDSLGGNQPPTEQTVDELRDSQMRLANEQARYQIAFRQDLADLAERLKRA